MECYNTNFRGISVAKATVLNHKMELFKLSQNDKILIDKLQTNLNINSLLPNLDIKDAKIYSLLVNQAFEKSQNFDMYETTLVSCDNKPCGIMIHSNKNKSKYVDYVASWPIEPNKKAPFTCKILFQYLYKEFLKTDKFSIELNATKFGSAISKYIALGFKMLGGDNYNEYMKISRPGIEKQLINLEKNIKIEEIHNPNDINLLDKFYY